MSTPSPSAGRHSADAVAAAVRHARRRLRRVRTGLREQGVVRTADLTLQTLLPGWAGIGGCALVMWSIPGPAALADPGGRWGGPEDVERLEPAPDRRALFHRRLQDGEMVWLLEEDGQVLGYAWYWTETHHDEDGLSVRMPPRSVWGADIVVRREMRGRGVGKRLLRSASKGLAEAGFDRIFAFVDLSNRSMHRMIPATGSEVRVRLTVLRLGGRVMVRECRDGHVRWRRGRAPVPIEP